MGVARSVVGSSLYPVNHYVVFLLFNREQGMAGAMDTCRISLGLVIVICQLLAFSHAGGKTLVLLDNALVKESHSIFFASLKGEFICLVLMRFRTIHFLFVIHARPPSGDGIPSEGSNTLPQSVMNRGHSMSNHPVPTLTPSDSLEILTKFDLTFCNSKSKILALLDK